MTDPLPPSGSFLPYTPHPQADEHLEAVVAFARQHGGRVTFQQTKDALGPEVAQDGLFVAMGRDVMTTGPLPSQPYVLAKRFL